jgi:hypothetical protein
VYVRLLGVRSEFEYVILRTLMALAGAYAAAGLLGAIEVQSKGIKAGGGLAVALLLFVFNPVGGVAVASAPAQKRLQIDAVDSLLKVHPERGTKVETVVDSLSKSLGYRNYEQLRVLGSTENAALLHERILGYRQRVAS